MTGINRTFEDAERDLSRLVGMLEPKDAANYRLAVAAIDGLVERYGGAGILAVWMMAAAYTREAEEGLADQSQSSAESSAGDAPEA